MADVVRPQSGPTSTFPCGMTASSGLWPVPRARPSGTIRARPAWPGSEPGSGTPEARGRRAPSRHRPRSGGWSPRGETAERVLNLLNQRPQRNRGFYVPVCVFVRPASRPAMIPLRDFVLALNRSRSIAILISWPKITPDQYSARLQTLQTGIIRRSRTAKEAKSKIDGEGALGALAFIHSKRC